MKIILVFTLLMSYLLGQSFSIDKNIQLKYKFTKANKIKGQLLITKNNSRILSKYYNISKSDKVPFYDKNKEFNFKIVDKKMIFNSLKNNGVRKTFTYDLLTADPDLLDMIGLAEPDIPTSSIIFDATGNVEYSVNKMQVFSAESLIIAIATQTLDIKDIFYLYEPKKNILFKVQLQNKGDTTINIDNNKIETTLYQLALVGGKKRLLNIYITPKGTPVKVESTKKRWSFDLIATGNMETINYDYLHILENKAKQK